MIYCYSFLEIWITSHWSKNVIVQKIYNYVDSIYDYFYPSTQQYLFVENGCQTIVFKSTDGDLSMLNELKPKTCDFILRNDYIKNDRNYKIIYDCVENIKPNYEMSNISFLFFIVHYKHLDIEIELSTTQYTYLIVGNRINKKFIYYLLKNMGFAKESFDDFDYSIQILIEQDLTLLNLTSSEEFVIMKNHLK